MQREQYPNAAFGYVSADEDIRLLLHHDPLRVKSGKEHDTVDPALLMLAIDLVDTIPVKGDDREVRAAVKRHLQSHANIVLWTDPDAGGPPIALQDKMRNFAFFKATMDGTVEVPPVQSEGRGVAYVMVDKTTREMTWWINFMGLTSSETVSHFHTGTGGKVGPIEIGLPTGNPKHGSAVLTESQMQDLFEGKMYVNIHSQAYPVGEIRGRLVPAATSRSNNAVDGTEVRPGIDQADSISPTPDQGRQVTPPDEKDPEAQVFKLEPGQAENDNGAIYSNKRADQTHQVVPPGTPPMPTGPGEQIVAPETPPVDQNPGPGEVITPPAEVDPKGQLHEFVQTEPDRKSGGGGPEQVTPPDDGDPTALDVRQIEQKGDRGAIYSQKDEKKKNKNKPKPEIRKRDGPVYSEDKTDGGIGTQLNFAQPAINVVIDGSSPLFTEETTQNVQRNGTFTGAQSPPSVTKSSLTDIDDPVNASLKNVIATVKADELQDDVVNLLWDEGFSGRLVVNKDRSKVLRIECAPKSRKSMNNLPDAAFAVVERGGRKDEGGRTAPRGLRHLPHHTGSVKSRSENTTLDLPRLRNALARINQIKASDGDSTARIKRVARAHLVQHAKATLPDSKFAKSSQTSMKKIIAEIDQAILQLVGQGVIKAQLNEIAILESMKLFRLDMGTEEGNFPFFVSVRFNGESAAESVRFDIDTSLPAEFIPDFVKFLKKVQNGEV
jgi:hypothetical protein